MRLIIFLCALLLSSVVNATPVPDTLRFTIYRDDAPIGTHTITLQQQGQTIQAEIAITMAVRIFGITFFKYEHRNREVWRDNALLSIDSTTDDNGTKYTVNGRTTPAGFMVQGSTTTTLPQPVVSTSYWNKQALRASQLLNTQKGDYFPITVTPKGEEIITASNRQQPAARYDVTGPLVISLWYGRDDRLLKLRFKARGSVIDYVLN